MLIFQWGSNSYQTSAYLLGNIGTKKPLSIIYNKIFYGGAVHFEIMLYIFLIVIKLINTFMILYFFFEVVCW